MFGDSLTYGGKWQDWFRNQRIINLGYASDTIDGMEKRIVQLEAVSPRRIFVMAGINGMEDNGVERTLSQYKELVTNIQSANPESEILIESILPIAKQSETRRKNNETICQINKLLRDFCSTNGFEYIDLHSEMYDYDKKELKGDLTFDGIHLNDKGYTVWRNGIKGFVQN